MEKPDYYYMTTERWFNKIMEENNVLPSNTVLFWRYKSFFKVSILLTYEESATVFTMSFTSKFSKFCLIFCIVLKEISFPSHIGRI